mmetsp:Transcript_22674/g.73371  ORF Transcript_22674/g.73371 Transcript_22674/m.73371 type:complete len:209 (+) Transcript_22674:186-812(+)|eukprot:scaffold21547_cov111-Isochrysis_galbana.AAC.4
MASLAAQSPTWPRASPRVAASPKGPQPTATAAPAAATTAASAASSCSTSHPGPNPNPASADRTTARSALATTCEPWWEEQTRTRSKPSRSSGGTSIDENRRTIARSSGYVFEWESTCPSCRGRLSTRLSATAGATSRKTAMWWTVAPSSEASRGVRPSCSQWDRCCTSKLHLSMSKCRPVLRAARPLERHRCLEPRTSCEMRAQRAEE